VIVTASGARLVLDEAARPAPARNNSPLIPIRKQ